MEADPQSPLDRRTLGRLAANLVLGLACCLSLNTATAANFRTKNFLIEASTPQLAKTVGEAAERYRHDLAVHWLGEPLPDWPDPCPIRVVDGPNLAAQGVTQYDPAPVRNFVMEVIGTQQRILDSVLPHEVSHTVLATHFGRPLPRWADEGICSTVEHESERAKHEAKLREFLRTRRGIPMNRLFLFTEYPNDVLPMYAQGYSVCRFLIAQRGPRQFIAFLHDYMEHPSWTDTIRQHYGYESLGELQEYWLAWVSSGSGPVERFAKHSPSPQESDEEPAAGPGRQAAPATSLASVQPDSFYLRKRDGREAPSDSSPDAVSSGVSVAVTPAANKLIPVPKGLIPPSVQNSGRYSAAQPQPEQGGARSGVIATPWAGQEPRRWR